MLHGKLNGVIKDKFTKQDYVTQQEGPEADIFGGAFG